MEIVIPAVAMTLIPITVGLTAIAKLYVDSKWAALISIVFGIALACLVPELGDWKHVILDGIVIGLSASGLYSGTKAVLK